jgi:hypothetical protein
MIAHRLYLSQGNRVGMTFARLSFSTTGLQNLSPALPFQKLFIYSISARLSASASPAP